MLTVVNDCRFGCFPALEHLNICRRGDSFTCLGLSLTAILLRTGRSTTAGLLCKIIPR